MSKLPCNESVFIPNYAVQSVIYLDGQLLFSHVDIVAKKVINDNMSISSKDVNVYE